MRQIVVSVGPAAGMVRVRGRRFVGRWVEFYALLGSARELLHDHGGWVTAEDLVSFDGWRHKTLLSIRKEVRDHCIRVNSVSGRPMIESPPRGQTRCWRAVSDVRFRFEPNRQAVMSRVSRDETNRFDDDEWRSTVQNIVSAAIATSERKLHIAHEALANIADLPTEEPELAAWVTVIRARAALQEGNADGSDSALAAWTDVARKQDLLNAVVEGQLRAFLWLASRFDHPNEALSEARRRILESEHRADTATLAIMENVAGVLARRAGHLPEALLRHRRAVALSGLAGDYRTVEASLSNYALCCRRSDKARGIGAQMYLLELIQTCRLICDEFRVGSDSIQTELNGARWAHEVGRRELRDHLLSDASQRIESNLRDAHFERGTFFYTKARLLADEDTGKASQAAERAVEAFDLAGDAGARATARTLHQQLVNTARR
jgi:hypothetical protein